MRKLFLFLCFSLASTLAWGQEEETFYYFTPSWSPDGKKLAFEGGYDGKFNVYVVDVDGKNLIKLTEDIYNDERPVWSPDGTKIGFFSNRSDKRNEQPVSLQIYVMNADGSDQRRVTHEGPALEYNVSWSPDGKELVFQSRPEIDPGVHSLYKIGVDGKDRERLTNGQFDDTSPQWSPEGDKIVFVQSKANYKFFHESSREDRISVRTSGEIKILNLKDGSISPVTQNEFQDLDPMWNADGSAVYYFEVEGEKKTYYRQKLGQTKREPLAGDEVLSGRGFIVWTRPSPDGKFLAYHKEVNGKWGLYIYDLEKEQEKLLLGGKPTLTKGAS